MCIPLIDVTYSCGHTEPVIPAGSGARRNRFCLVPGFCDDLGFVRKIRRESQGDCSLCYAKWLVKQQANEKSTKQANEKARHAAAVQNAAARSQRRATELQAKSDRGSQLEAAPTREVLETLNTLAMKRLETSIATCRRGTDFEMLLGVAISLPLVDKSALVERLARGFARVYDDESCAQMATLARVSGNMFGEAFKRGARI